MRLLQTLVSPFPIIPSCNQCTIYRFYSYRVDRLLQARTLLFELDFATLAVEVLGMPALLVVGAERELVLDTTECGPDAVTAEVLDAAPLLLTLGDALAEALEDLLAALLDALEVLPPRPLEAVAEHTQPAAAVAILVTGGPFVQYALNVREAPTDETIGAFGRNCALTKTGMMAPVLRENVL